jgi:hypothetical protein
VLKQRRIRRYLFAAMPAAAAVVFALAGAVPAQAAVITTAWNGFSLGRYMVRSGACTVQLQTSRLTGDAPAYISAELLQGFTADKCMAVLLRSGNGGKTFTQVGVKLILPPDPAGQVLAISRATYDGPGEKARACVWTAKTRRVCTFAITLGAGKGVPANPALPASFDRAFIGANDCGGQLNSTTLTKQRGSFVDASFEVKRTVCVGWIQVSDDKGKTWRTVYPRTVFSANADNPLVQAYLGPHPDGPGRIARVCTQSPAESKATFCTVSW